MDMDIPLKSTLGRRSTISTRVMPILDHRFSVWSKEDIRKKNIIQLIHRAIQATSLHTLLVISPVTHPTHHPATRRAIHLIRHPATRRVIHPIHHPATRRAIHLIHHPATPRAIHPIHHPATNHLVTVIQRRPTAGTGARCPTVIPQPPVMDTHPPHRATDTPQRQPMTMLHQAIQVMTILQLLATAIPHHLINLVIQHTRTTTSSQSKKLNPLTKSTDEPSCMESSSTQLNVLTVTGLQATKSHPLQSSLFWLGLRTFCIHHHHVRRIARLITINHRTTKFII